MDEDLDDLAEEPHTTHGSNASTVNVDHKIAKVICSGDTPMEAVERQRWGGQNRETRLKDQRGGRQRRRAGGHCSSDNSPNVFSLCPHPTP
jgi:hypothetical protein